MHRALAIVSLVIGLASPVACGGRAAPPMGGMCQTVPWGGFNGTSECHGISQQLIQGQHRGCTQDADCALLAANPCSAHAVNGQFLQTYASFPPPCNHPLAGMCFPVQWRVVCTNGCCAPSSGAAPPTF